MSRRFHKYTEILRTISTFCCRPFERSRDLDIRRRFRERWGKMIDSKKNNKTSPFRLRIRTPSFFECQVISDRRFSSKHDVPTMQFLSRCLLHTLWSSVSKVYRVKLQADSRHSPSFFDQTKTYVQTLHSKNYVRSRPRRSSIFVVRGAAQDSLHFFCSWSYFIIHF